MSRKRKSKSIPVRELFRTIKRQLDRAVQEVRETKHANDESIHQVRLRCKRVRAYLKLIGIYDEKTARRVAKHVRDAARALSTLRDRQVIPNALEQARLHLTEKQVDVEECVIQDLMQTGHSSADAAAEVESHSLHDALAITEKHLKKAKRLLRKSKQTHAAVLDASTLARGYRECRTRIRQCRVSELPEDFHELRKAVKSHWYQCKYLKSISTHKLSVRCQQLRSLAETMGSAQDVTVAQRALDKKQKNSAAQDSTSLACQRLSEELNRRALTVACELFFDRGKEFFKDLDR